MADELRISITAQDSASKVFSAIAKEAQSVAKSLEDAGKEGASGFQKLEQEATKADKSLHQVSQSGDGVIRDMDGLSGSLFTVGAGLRNLGDGLDKLGGQFLDQSRQVKAIQALYGDASADFLKYADTIQNTTLFSDDQAREAEQYFATLKNNYDVSEADIKRLISISADLAQTYGVSLADASERVQASIRGEGESVEALGLTMNQQSIDRNNLTLSMSNQEAAQFRLNALYSQTANVEGQATAAVNTANGAWQQFKNTTQDVEQTLGSVIGPAGDMFTTIGSGLETVGEASRGLRDIKSGILGLVGAAASAGPVGLAVAGVAAALGIAGFAFLKNKADAEAAKAAWDSAGKSLDALSQKSTSFALEGNSIAASWAGGVASQTTTFFSTINSQTDQLLDDLDHKTIDKLTGTSEKIAELWISTLRPDQITDFIGNTFSDSGMKKNSDNLKQWVKDTFDDPDLQSSVATDLQSLFSLEDNPYVDKDQLHSGTDAILKEMLSTDDVGAADAAFKQLYQDLANGAADAAAKMKTLKQNFDIDDLRVQGKFQLADDLKQVSTQIDDISKSWQKIDVPQNIMKGFDPGDQTALLQHNAAALQMSASGADEFASAQDRINKAVASGSIDNQRLSAAIADIVDQRNKNIAAGMSEAQANDIEQQAIVALSGVLGDYTKALSDAQQAQLSFSTSSANVLSTLRDLDFAKGGGATDYIEKWNTNLGVSLDLTSKALDGALAVFDQIDALGQRSSSAASIATNLIGDTDTLGALPDLMNRIADGTSKAFLSHEDYTRAMGAGTSIIQANAAIQDDLLTVQAKQLPYLAAQEQAYARNVNGLAQLNAADQRHVLLLQDQTVQQGLANVATLQGLDASSDLAGANADQIASFALLNPEVAEALTGFHQLKVNSQGYYEVLGKNGTWVTSTIKAQTDAVTAQSDAAAKSANNWDKWVQQAQAAGLSADELKQNLTDLKDTLTGLSGIDSSILNIDTMGLGGLPTELAGNLEKGGAALGNAYRVIVSNTEGIKQQFQELDDWGTKLIGDQGTWSRMDELLDKHLISGTHGVFDDGSQYAKAQQAFDVIKQVNESVADSIDAIQVNLAPTLATLAQGQAAYIDQLRQLPPEQQLATLGWMDQTEAASAYQLATMAADAAAGKFGDTGMQMANDAISAAAAADPVMAAMLEQMGLISIGADGTITVTTDGLDAATTGLDDLNESLEILSLLIAGVPPAKIKAEIDGKGDVDDLYNDLLGLPKETDTKVKVEMVYPSGDPGSGLAIGGGDLSKFPPVPVTGNITEVTPPAETPSIDVTANIQVGNATVGDGTGGPTYTPPPTVAPTDTTQTVTINAVDNASAVIAGVQTALTALPPITNVTVSTSTLDAASAMATLKSDIDDLPDITTLSILAAAAPATNDINGVGEALANLPSTTNVGVAAATLDAVTGIDSVGAALANLPGETDVSVVAYTADAVSAIDAVIDAMSNVSSKTVGINVVTSYSTIGAPPSGVGIVARNGGVMGYDDGGVVARMGEAGAELLRFADGGTAWAMTDGLYDVPNHTLVTPAPASRGYMAPGGGITLNVTVQGNVYGVDDLTETIMSNVAPALGELVRQQRAGMGVQW